jgi:sigma-E factor negative regulatory protein RseA
MTRPAPTPEPDLRRQWLSDLADGRLQGEVLAGACRDWAGDAEARRTWHAYHLIGDLLRAEDLSADAGRDAAFLARLRTRLAAEPVVLAPAAMSTRPRRQAWGSSSRQTWLMPLAAAAGFVAVAGVVVVLRQAVPEGAAAGPQLAAGGAMVLPVRATSRGQMLRDAQVDAYLNAHREALAGSPPALPGGGVRNVDFNVPQR